MRRSLLALVGVALLRSAASAATPYDTLEPGVWTVVSQNTLKDMDPCPTRDCSYSAVEGISAVINDWNGGVFASGFGTLGGLAVWGGGHNGYFGSEIYVFDLASQRWQRVSEPYDDGSSSVAAKCSDEGVYPDGSACPTHTYNSIEYHPSTNRLVLLIGTPDPVAGGAYDGRAHLFDFSTRTWSLGAKFPGSYGYDAPSAYDAKRDVFWQMYGYSYQLGVYDPDSNLWTNHGSPGTWEIDGAGKIDPVHDLLVFVDARGSTKMYGLPLGTPDVDLVELKTSGNTEIQGKPKLGFEWEPTSKRFVAWDEGAEVYVLNPPSDDWRSGTWVWSRVTPAASNTVVPTRNANGTYGRFRYAASINAFLLVSAYDGPVWAYRLTPGVGTGPNPEPLPSTPDLGSSPPGVTSPAERGCGCSVATRMSDAPAPLALVLLLATLLRRARARSSERGLARAT